MFESCMLLARHRIYRDEPIDLRKFVLTRPPPTQYTNEMPCTNEAGSKQSTAVSADAGLLSVNCYKTNVIIKPDELVLKKDVDVETEADIMKDIRSLTGFHSAFRVMAVSPDGSQLLFKKTNKCFYLYNTDDVVQCGDIQMQGIDVCHVDDTIFDVAFLSSNELVAILQDTNRVLHVFKGLLDVESRIIRVVTPVTSSCISIRKHYSTSVIIDENGPVLISYPVTFRKRSPNDTTDDDAKIELLHLHDYYRMNGVKTITVYPRVKDKIALFCDPFIYRNHVYLFNRFETSVLCIAISGDDRETVRLLNTYPDPCYGIPDSKYANRCSLVLADVVLIYCYQRLDKPDQEPQLWKLELGPMRWHQLQLSLSTHTPSAQVCLQRAALNSVAFLHGECRRRTCQEKAHLYQLSLDQDCVQSANGPTSFLNKLSGIGTLVDKLTDSVKRSISSVDIHFMSPSTSDSANVSSAVPPVPSSINNSARTPPTVRYAARKTARTKVCKPNHRSSSVTCSKRSGVILSECPTQERAHSVHWSEEMAAAGDATTITEQLSLAKEMGFTDEEIMQAVSLNCAKDGVYRPFSSTSAMIDMLQRVQRICDPSGPTNVMVNSADSGLELDKTSFSFSHHTPPETPTPEARHTVVHFRSSPSSSGTSFEDPTSPSSSTSDTHRRVSNPPFQLQRLLDAFEKDRKSYSEESERSIRMLEEKCRLFVEKHNILQSRIIDKDTEIQRLKALLHDQTTFSEQLRSVKVKLDEQLLDNESKKNQIRVLKEQAELVTKRHLNELREKDELISDLYRKKKEVEDAGRLGRERQLQMQQEIDDLKKQLCEAKADLEKCRNYHEEIRKAEMLIEEIRSERDEVRSTLNKVPTCVICLDKRPQMLYMPCSHFICCETCGSRFENCPACRHKICGKITVYQ